MPILGSCLFVRFGWKVAALDAKWSSRWKVLSTAVSEVKDLFSYVIQKRGWKLELTSENFQWSRSRWMSVRFWALNSGLWSRGWNSLIGKIPDSRWGWLYYMWKRWKNEPFYSLHSNIASPPSYFVHILLFLSGLWGTVSRIFHIQIAMMMLKPMLHEEDLKWKFLL